MSKIEDGDIKKLNQMFKDKNDLDSIVKFVNTRTISNDMEQQEVKK